MGITAYMMVQVASIIDDLSLSMKSGIYILVIGWILHEYFTWLFIVTSSYSSSGVWYLIFGLMLSLVLAFIYEYYK